MKRFLIFLSCVVLFVLGVYAWKQAQTSPGGLSAKVTLATQPPLDPAQIPSLQAIDAEFTKLVNSVVPSVVSITTTTRVRTPAAPGVFDPFADEGRFHGVPRESVENSLGSGVIVSREGHILTNNHVIAEVDEIRVQLSDGRILPARLVGADEQSDLAVLKIEAADLTPLPFADSNQVQVGQRVIAVGNPFGFEETVTQGIISAKGRRNAQSGNEFLQTDAAINPGNSGGPLINLRGEIVAINTAIYSTQESAPGSQGVGFAIPSSFARSKLETMLKAGRIIRGYLGVLIQNLPPTVAEQLQLPRRGGVLVVRTMDGSPAQRADLQPSDIILSLNGQAINNTQNFRSLIAAVPVGQKARIEFIRDGAVQTTDAVIAEQPPQTP